MIENNIPRDHIEYVEICKTIKKKAREDIRKTNLNEIRETIEASKSLKKVRRTHRQGQKPDDNTTGQTRQIDPKNKIRSWNEWNNYTQNYMTATKL